MKTTLLSIVFFFLLCNLHSQIVITGNDMPQAGKVYSVAYHTAPSVSIGSASPITQIWNFSSLQKQYYKVASFSPTAPYHFWGTNFVGANLFTYGPSYMFSGLYGGAPVDQSMWGYMYWKSDNTGLHIVGWRGDYGMGNKNVLESPQELLMSTPASYDSVFYNNSKWEIILTHPTNLYDTNYVVRVKKTLTADAFGQLTTPHGTFDVLRVHEYYIETDSVYASHNGIPITYPGSYYILSTDTLNNYYFWAKNIGYPIAIARADKNNTLLHIEFLDSTYNSYSITGQVLMHNGINPVGTGFAASYAHDSWDHLFGVDEQIPLDTAGHFQFANVLQSNRMIHAMPDTALYPSEMPSYYGNAILWNNASILSVTRDTNIVITCVGNDSTTFYNSGSGQINGIVYVDTSASKANLLASQDITIILLEGDSMVTAKHGKTNHLGNFHFKNLPPSKYKIAVEIAGVLQDSTYSIQINSNTVNDINFYYDSTKVYLYNSSGIHTVRNYGLTHVVVYPNPLTDKTTFLISNPEEKESSYSLTVFDLTGKTVMNKSGKTVDQIELKRENLKTGIYFFSLELNGVIATRGKLIVK